MMPAMGLPILESVLSFAFLAVGTVCCLMFFIGGAGPPDASPLSAGRRKWRRGVLLRLLLGGADPVCGIDLQQPPGMGVSGIGGGSTLRQLRLAVSRN